MSHALTLEAAATICRPVAKQRTPDRFVRYTCGVETCEHDHNVGARFIDGAWVCDINQCAVCGHVVSDAEHASLAEWCGIEAREEMEREQDACINHMYDEATGR